MAVEIIENEHHKVIFCNTTMVAFGPVFSSDENIEELLAWLPCDARTYDQKELYNKYYEWRGIRNLSDIKNIDQSSIVIDGITKNDYPKFCDAFIIDSSFNDGTQLTDEQNEKLTEENGDLINELIHENQLYI